MSTLLNQPDYKFLNISARDDLKRIKFLLSGVSTDAAREVLQCILIDGEHGKAVTADGFRLHYCEIPECLHEYGNKLILFEKGRKPRLGLNIIQVFERDHQGLRFPDYWAVLEPTLNRQNFYALVATRDLLKKTISEIPSDDIRFSFKNPDDPYLIAAADDLTDCKTILMPRHDNLYKLTELGDLVAQLKEIEQKAAKLEREDLTRRVRAIQDTDFGKLLPDAVTISQREAITEKVRALTVLFNQLRGPLDTLESLRSQLKDIERGRSTFEGNGYSQKLIERIEAEFKPAATESPQDETSK